MASDEQHIAIPPRNAQSTPDGQQYRASTVGGATEVFHIDGQERAMKVATSVFLLFLGCCLAGMGYLLFEINLKAESGTSLFVFEPARYVKAGILLSGGIALISIALYKLFRVFTFRVEVSPEKISVNQDTLSWSQIEIAEHSADGLLLVADGTTLEVPTSVEAFDY